ncbi:MAG: LamG-like jellyroll fold domain-containing protein [Flavobacteriales bacterium]
MKKRLLFLATLGLSSITFSQNTALHFDSLNTNVQTTYAGIPGGTGARTIEAWIKTTSNHVPNANGKQGAIADYGSFVTGGRFTFCVLWGDAIRIEVGGNGLSGSIAVNDGNWHHVAVVYNHTATNKYSLFVDSVLDVAGNLTVPTNTGSTTNFRIGKRIDGVSGFRGSIDEVRFYNYARTLAQIGGERFDEYCSLPSGLVAYYKFNEGLAGGSNTGKTTAIDYAGNNDGTLTNFLLTGATRNYVSGPALTPGLTKSSVAATTCGSYTSPSGKVFSSTGIYYDTLTNSVLCDSLIEYDITISNRIITQTIAASGCNSFTTQLGQTFTTSGTYYDTIGASAGCDSLVQYNVTVTPIDSTVTQSGITLTASDTWAAHQWIDCNNNSAPIAGETTRTFTPTSTGSYACIVTRGACSDTSSCRNVVINNASINENLKALYQIYPNPATNDLSLSYALNLGVESITIFDITGKVVFTTTKNFTSIHIAELSKGLYTIRLNTSNGSSTKRFIKN